MFVLWFAFFFHFLKGRDKRSHLLNLELAFPPIKTCTKLIPKSKLYFGFCVARQSMDGWPIPIFISFYNGQHNEEWAEENERENEKNVYFCSWHTSQVKQYFTGTCYRVYFMNLDQKKKHTDFLFATDFLVPLCAPNRICYCLHKVYGIHRNSMFQQLPAYLCMDLSEVKSCLSDLK